MMESAEQLKARICGPLLTNAEYYAFVEAVDYLKNTPRKLLRLNPLRRSEADLTIIPVVSQTKGLSSNELGYLCDANQLSYLSDLALWQAAGLCFLQEPSAAEVANSVVKHHDKGLIVDVCAAPGAKATFLGERLNDSDFLVANDLHPQRAKKLSALLSRQGIWKSSVWSLSPKELTKMLGPVANTVLVDAPCSSESFFAKREEKRKDVKDFEVRDFARMQRDALKEAYGLLAVGGVLIYSTCTYNKIENEDQIEWLLGVTDDLKLLDEQRRWPHLHGAPGGYWAVLKKHGELADDGPVYDKKIYKKHGLIRHCSESWRGERELYHEVMCGAFDGKKVELSRDRALQYLKGESLHLNLAEEHLRGELALLWKNQSIGCGKAVEGRINNLLPKTLRIF